MLLAIAPYCVWREDRANARTIFTMYAGSCVFHDPHEAPDNILEQCTFGPLLVVKPHGMGSMEREPRMR